MTKYKVKPPPKGVIANTYVPAYERNADVVWTGEKWAPVFTEDNTEWTPEARAAMASEEKK